MSVRKVLGLSLLVSSLLGCSSSGISEYEAYRRASAEATCAVLFDCPHASSNLSMLRVVYGSKEHCIEATLTEHEYPLLARAFEHGTVRFDAVAQAECMEGVRTVCSPLVFTGVLPACSRVLVGTVGLGGACQDSTECAIGTCDAPEAGGCGTCIAPTVGLGDPCFTAHECMPSEQGLVTCAGAPRTCQLENPGALTVVSEGGTCDSVPPSDGALRACAQGTFCDPGTHTCRAVIPRGEPCVKDGEACEVGTACFTDLGTLVSGGASDDRCRRIELQTREGAPCDMLAAEPVFCDQNAELICDDDEKRCVRFGHERLGDACYGDRNCGNGLFCNASEDDEIGSTCAPVLEKGASCERDAMCASGHCDVPGGQVVGTCVDAEPLPPVCGA